MQALVVDDSKATRLILRHILKQIGFEVVEAADGRQGLEQLKQLSNPTIVLVDWNMPEMTRLDFIRAVRADATNRGLRLLMVSSEDVLEQIAAALEWGADGYLKKPFTKELIREKLELLSLPLPIAHG